MPQRRLRRAGSTAAVSAGALTIVLLTAGPADAAPSDCPKGTDPASTLENWKCQWDDLLGNKPAPTPTPKTSKAPAKAPVKKTPTKKTPAAKTPASGGNRSGAASGNAGRVSGNTPVTAYTRADKVTPYSPTGTPDLPGLLPQPDVADAPLPTGAQNGSAGVLHTRLMAPVASAGRPAGGQMLWVAAASGLAGAVGALNISVAGRRLRSRGR